MSQGSYSLHEGDVMDAYPVWPSPALIVSDGAYGVGGFHGDPRVGGSLARWYRPHIEAWSKAAQPFTTLWFWNREIGWAEVHPLLVEYGWQFEQVITWDKGIRHVAGNVNGKTLRHFPIVSEVCVFYSRRIELPTCDGLLNLQAWMRYEWQRSGLPLNRANEACGVRNAATRKYLTRDWLWYFPPAEMMAALVSYINNHGNPSGRPYYSLDGVNPVSASEWRALRYKWKHAHGLTNIWHHPPLHDAERLKNATGRRHAPRVHKPTVGVATAHLNQKPLEFMRRILNAATEPGDIVWEPFGGLCSASVAAVELGRRAFAAEMEPTFAALARNRLSAAAPAVLRGIADELPPTPRLDVPGRSTQGPGEELPIASLFDQDS